MAKKAIIFLADGFEETEALAPYDILKRGGVDVKLVSVMNSVTVVSSHGVSVNAQSLLEDGLGEYDLLMLPGGMPGTLNLDGNEVLKDEVVKAVKDGKIVSAICAAPMILGQLGLLKGKRATCYPGFEKYLSDANVFGEQVEHDGNIITGVGAGAAFSFGLELLATLTDRENALKVKDQIILK